MLYDFKAARWACDAHSFYRYSKLMETFTQPWAREMVRKRMLEIQQRWPQYIKEDEIPQ